MFFTQKLHQITKTALVSHSADDMFNLVNQIKAYPQFLSWCANSRILSQTDTQITASLEVRKGVFNQNFTTINTLSNFEDTQTIHMRLKDGPFKSLVGSWSFKALNDNACRVNFDIEFSFDSKLMDLTIAPIFSQIASTQLSAFVARADAIYKTNIDEK